MQADRTRRMMTTINWQWILLVIFILAITPLILFTKIGAKIFIVSILICLGVTPFYCAYQARKFLNNKRSDFED